MHDNDIKSLLRALRDTNDNFKEELLAKMKDNQDVEEVLFYYLKYLPQNQKFKKENSIIETVYDHISAKLGKIKAYVYEFIHIGLDKPLYLGKSVETQQNIKRFKDHFKYSSPLTRFPLHLLDCIYIYTYEELNKFFSKIIKPEDKKLKKTLDNKLSNLERYLYEEHEPYFNYKLSKLDRKDYNEVKKLIDHENPTKKIFLKDFYNIFRSLDGGCLMEYFKYSKKN